MSFESLPSLIGTGVDSLSSIDRRFLVPTTEDFEAFKREREFLSDLVNNGNSDDPRYQPMLKSASEALALHAQQLAWRMAHSAELSVANAELKGATVLLTVGSLITVASLTLNPSMMPIVVLVIAGITLVLAGCLLLMDNSRRLANYQKQMQFVIHSSESQSWKTESVD